jgi:hypothetical protein
MINRYLARLVDLAQNSNPVQLFSLCYWLAINPCGDISPSATSLAVPRRCKIYIFDRMSRIRCSAVSKQRPNVQNVNILQKPSYFLYSSCIS